MFDALLGDPLLLLAATGLGLSGFVSAIRLIDWFIHSDPKVVAQTGRWAAVGLAVLSVPLLIGLLLNQKWTSAMLLAAVMLLAAAFYGPRALARLGSRRLRPDWSPATGADTSNRSADVAVPDAELVQHSIFVLEEYLRRTAGVSKRNGKDVHAVSAQSEGTQRPLPSNGRGFDGASAPMTRAEALEILALGSDSSQQQIDDAHRRLMQLIHPDRGGSHYFTVKVNQAKDALMGSADTPTESGAAIRPRKPGRRRPQRQQEP
jgi:hypothetical protein